jgi:hypothetical protein
LVPFHLAEVDIELSLPPAIEPESHGQPE